MYPYYIDFFKEKDELKPEDIVIGIGFTYSWMPTIPKKLNFTELGLVTEILNNVKKGVLISNDQLIKLKIFGNNSLVGASKLLHFVNPEQYPIWDSRVIKFLNAQTTSVKFNSNNADSYLKYMAYVTQLKSDGFLKEAIIELNSNFNNTLTDFRAIELLFFLAAKHE